METLFQDKYRIKSNRRPFWDYSRFGWYFITICTQNKEHYFGEIVDGEMILNNIGNMVNDEWKISENIRKEITLDCFVVMPNHLHGIVIINNVETNGRSSLPTVKFRMKPKSVSSLLSGFKSSTTSKFNTIQKTIKQPLWQSNYYDHIVRDDDDLKRIRRYIKENPQNWYRDRNNPEGLLM